MGKVRLLPDIVACQVAAGEVVERPASVLKELIENSLDAGAKRIDVEFDRGGQGVIKVRDDGCGMEREDALLSLERHATSKIRTGDDLARITTFGFRGEAVPSIASVSRFRLATRTREAESGTEIRIDGGKIISVLDCGDSPGTAIEVNALFFNLPARKKFLRTELTEVGHLLHTFQTFAIAHPEVVWTLTKDGRLLHHLAATEDLRVRVRDLLGNEWFENLLAMPPVETCGIQVAGLLAKPGFHRMDRSGQFFYLNRRPVQDVAISRGLRAALAGSGEQRGYPAGIFFLTMDAARFDCNVHPAKREVRFHRPDEISMAVEAFVRSFRNPFPSREVTVPTSISQKESSAPVSPCAPPPERASASEPLRTAPLPVRPVPSMPQRVLQTETLPFASENDAPPNQEAAISAEESTVPPFQYRGTLGSRYLLWESEEGLVLLDIHHAYERIYYEEMIRFKKGKAHPSQQLLPPATLKLDPRDAIWVLENATLLSEFGLIVEGFGVDVVKIDALPAGLEDWDAEELLLRLVDESRSGAKISARRFLHDQLALTFARLRSRKGMVSTADFQNLLKRLFSCDMPYTSPSGSPTLLQMGWSELSRKFQA